MSVKEETASRLPCYDEVVVPQDANDFNIYRIVSNETPLSYHFMPTYIYDTRDQVLKWTNDEESKDADAQEEKSHRKGSIMRIVRKIFT